MSLKNYLGEKIGGFGAIASHVDLHYVVWNPLFFKLQDNLFTVRTPACKSRQ